MTLHPLAQADLWRDRATAHRTPVTDDPADGEVVWHRWVPDVVSDATPLVLLHGGSGSWTHWLPTLPTLMAAGRIVWAADTPGYGDSAPPPDGSTTEDLLPPLQRGLKQLLGDQPVDLVGFSLGGLLSAMWVAAEPQRARRVVVVGPPGLGIRADKPFQLRAWRHLPREQQAAIHRHNLAALMLFDASRIDDTVLAWQTDNVERDRLPRRRLAAPDYLVGVLQRVQTPLVAIVGELDALYRGHMDEVRGVFERNTADFRGLTLLPGAGHWVMFEAQAAFDAALLKALKA